MSWPPFQQQKRAFFNQPYVLVTKKFGQRFKPVLPAYNSKRFGINSLTTNCRISRHCLILLFVGLTLFFQQSRILGGYNVPFLASVAVLFGKYRAQVLYCSRSLRHFSDFCRFEFTGMSTLILRSLDKCHTPRRFIDEKTLRTSVAMSSHGPWCSTPSLLSVVKVRRLDLYETW